MDPIGQFENWLDLSKRGDRYIYYCGSLMITRTFREIVNDLAKRVWASYKIKQVTLVQRRYMGGFEYIAVRL